jgi:hypothetical protein
MWNQTVTSPSLVEIQRFSVGNEETPIVGLRQKLSEPILEDRTPESVVGLLSRWTVNVGDILLLHALIFYCIHTIKLQKSDTYGVDFILMKQFWLNFYSSALRCGK